jgi:hypothetical protein
MRGDCSTGKTYAAVAAKISTRRAFVAMARQPENRKVKAQTSPSLALALLTKESTIIDIKGANEENIVPSMFVNVSISRSS